MSTDTVTGKPELEPPTVTKREVPTVTISELSPDTVTAVVPSGDDTVRVWKAVSKVTGFPLESSAWRTRPKIETGSLPPAMVKSNVRTLRFWFGSAVESWGDPWVALRVERDPGSTEIASLAAGPTGKLPP